MQSMGKESVKEAGARPRSAIRHHNEDSCETLHSPRRMVAPRALEVMPLLHDQLAVLSGGRDRRGGPVLTFQATPNRDKARIEDYKNLLHYLVTIPSEECRDQGFSVVIDMRGGSTWSSVKPILKCLQEHFEANVAAAHIVKPDNFWQKQRTSLASQKYKFETNLIGLDALYKYIDPGQLTSDLDGSLHYDHATWIDLRCALEDFLWQSMEMLDRLASMREDLKHNDFADDVVGAKKAIDAHNEAKRRILKVPVETIDNIGQRLLQRLSTGDSGTSSYDSGYSCRDSNSSSLTLISPDVQHCVPRVMGLLEEIHCQQQHLLQLWTVKKLKLDECLQLRIFEQDCDKMFDYIQVNRQRFLENYVAMGQSLEQSKRFQEEHNGFTKTSNQIFASINNILGQAAKLIENNHYASAHVRTVANRLDRSWKHFAACLDERTTVLALAVHFHQKAENYMTSVSSWATSCDASAPSVTSASSLSVSELESSIERHQNLYGSMCHAYSEVHSTSKKLLYQLDHLVKMCINNNATISHSGQQQAGSLDRVKSKSRSSESSSEDYSSGAQHVLSVIHEILNRHRSLETQWHTKKIKLHQRLALRLFQEDVKQVLDWLQNHGEVFLRKNVGIGRNLAKAKAYQKSHQTFEGVVQNTYTNAEKLLSAASELAQTGECNAEDIYGVAHELEAHIASFALRVEQRRHLLHAAIVFYTHIEELSQWLGELRLELQSDEVSEDGLEGAEKLIEHFNSQRDSTLDACASTIQEGTELLQRLQSCGVTMELDTSGSMSSVQTTLDRLTRQRDELGELWSSRKIRLDLCLQLRVFERDAVELSSQYELWSEQLQNAAVPLDPKECEAQLRHLKDHLTHIQRTTSELVQRGKEIAQNLEGSGITLVSEGHLKGESRLQVLLEFLNEREIDLEHLAGRRRSRLEQQVQMAQFESDATQVIRWIQSAEGMLTAGFAIPGSLKDAEQLRKEHEHFQTAIEKTHASAVHVRQRAESLLQQKHFDGSRVRSVADGVTTRWQQLVTRAEERHKLVTASLNFFKTADQVCSVLDSLEREYRRDDSSLLPPQSPKHDEDDEDRVTTMHQMVTKHQEQKEAFLKACTLARRTAETFLKYSNRSLHHLGTNESTFRGPEAKVKVILERLLAQENRVLEFWTTKKKLLEQSQQYCMFETSARQSLKWIKNEGSKYIQSHQGLQRGDREETTRMLQDYQQFKAKADESREKIELLLQLANNLMDKHHTHSSLIRQWAMEIDEAYKGFSSEIEEHRRSLEANLGEEPISKKMTVMCNSEVKSGALGNDRGEQTSTPDKGLEGVDEETRGEKRRSVSGKEFKMAELLETERVYVKDLQHAVTFFLNPMRYHDVVVPDALVGKEDIVFGNLEHILNFHQNVFLNELLKYEDRPEDVGHCFVTWAPKFDMYVDYCTNHPRSSTLLVEHGARFFDWLQHRGQLDHPIDAYLIKPVQRITKYQLLLKDLLSFCNNDNCELKEGLDVCLSVPKKANDALHLSMLEGCNEDLRELGDVVLHESFQISDNKQLIRKVRDRHVFLFELFLIIAKEVKDATGKSNKYLFKSKIMTSEMSVSDDSGGDNCKLAIAVGRTQASSENKLILKAPNVEVKQTWLRKLRELIDETYLNGALPTLAPPSVSSSASSNSNNKGNNSSSNIKSRLSREFDEYGVTLSLDGSAEHLERGSLASFGSGTTTDSDNRQNNVNDVNEDNMNAANKQSKASKGNKSTKDAEASFNESVRAPSPQGKKKGFGGKWLPNIRKLSQSKLDRAAEAEAGTRAKTKSKFKLSDAAVREEELPTSASPATTTHFSIGPTSSSSLNTSSTADSSGDMETLLADVPPPMAPIASSMMVLTDNNDLTSTDNGLKMLSMDENGVREDQIISSKFELGTEDRLIHSGRLHCRGRLEIVEDANDSEPNDEDSAHKFYVDDIFVVCLFENKLLLCEDDGGLVNHEGRLQCKGGFHLKKCYTEILDGHSFALKRSADCSLILEAEDEESRSTWMTRLRNHTDPDSNTKPEGELKRKSGHVVPHHPRLRCSHSDVEAHSHEDESAAIDSVARESLSLSSSTLPRSSSRGCTASFSKVSTRKNFLEGFRHTLRPRGVKEALMRTNSDSVANHRASGSLVSDDHSLNLREPLLSGSRVKTMLDYSARGPQELSVRRGDVVRVIDFDVNKGYHVVIEGEESNGGWVPVHVINLLSSATLKKPSWSLLPKRKRSKSVIEVFATVGQRNVVLSCPKSREGTTCVWTLPDDRVIVRSSARFVVKTEGTSHALEIVGEVREEQEGAYVVLERDEERGLDLASTLVHLRLLKPLTSAPEFVQDVQGPRLRWSNPDLPRGTFNVEYSTSSSSAWQLLRSGLHSCSCPLSSFPTTVQRSSTLVFRVVRIEDGQISPLSAPWALDGDLQSTINDDTGLRGLKALTSTGVDLDAQWQRDFERKFIELEELGRGRFSVVRRCQHIVSGEEKAVKFVNRARQARSVTQTEFQLLLKLASHPCVIEADAIFVTSTSDAIVMDMITGVPLLEHVCEEPMYSEELVRRLLQQLTQALAHVHSRQVAHLDVKPENVMVAEAGRVVLVDFGLSRDVGGRFDDEGLRNDNGRKESEGKAHAESMMREVEINCNSADLEFLAPEIVTHTSADTPADMWSLGVIVYVALSGVSPFLDDSVDETRHNLLTCDFSFPSEYFSKVSREAQLLASRLLRPDPKMRLSAEECLRESWLQKEGETRPLISSLTLATLNRRRSKKLNSLVPILDRVRNRPESYYYSKQ